MGGRAGAVTEVAGTPAAPPPPLTKRRLRLIFGSLMLVMFVSTLDLTVVSTALPTIVGDLGGIEYISWVVTAYLLSSTVVGPLYGKLGDLYGRKRLLQSAILLFVFGSLLCAVAQDIGQLIVFRAIQGLGGGGLLVTASAVSGDIVSPRERGRYFGYTATAVAVATGAGPLLGGLFVERLSWRWIFFVNLPLGVAVMLVIGIVFTSRPVVVEHRIDYAGAFFLTTALSAFVLFASLGGHSLAWSSWPSLVLAATAVGATVGLLAVERRAVEPMLPLELFSLKTIAVGSALAFVAGVGTFGALTFLPSYLQVVKGQNPVASGVQMIPLIGGILAGSMLAGQLVSRWGRYRVFPILGCAMVAAGFVGLGTIAPDTGLWSIMIFMLVVGVGTGLIQPVLTVVYQNAVDHKHMGVASSNVQLFRQIGALVGVAVLGAIFVNRLGAEVAQRLTAASAPTTTDPATIQTLPAAVRTPYVDAFAAALHPVFWVATLVALAGVALAWVLPEVALRETRHVVHVLPAEPGADDVSG